MLGPILVGAILGALFAVAAHRWAGGEIRVFSLGLVITALIYVGLALPAADGRWLALEAAGVAIFGGIAWLGLRWPAVLAMGWAGHVVWDVALHLGGPQPVVGSWYPLGCIGFDLIVAGFLLAGAVRSSARGFVLLMLGVMPAALRAQDTVRPGAPRVTNLAGARDRPGLFTQRLIFPANFCGPLHTHDHDLHGLVLRGILRMGFADSTGRIDVREYPAGSFVAVPAGKVHLEGSAVETEIHLSGIGPLVTTVVDSSRSARCSPTSQ